MAAIVKREKSLWSNTYDSISRVMYRYPGFAQMFNFAIASPDEIDIETALRCATVFTCVQIVSSGIGEVKFSAPDHSKLDMLLKKPNEWQNGSEYIQSVAFDMLTAGHAFSRIVGGKDNPTYLAPEKPDDIRVKADAHTRPSYAYRTSAAGIRSSHMLHFRDIGSHSVNGCSRIEAGAQRIRALIAADNLITSVFKNGIAVSYVVKSNYKMDTEALKKTAENLKKNLDAKSKGSGNLLVLDNSFDIDTIEGLKPSDTDLRELRTHLIREITSLWGVPPFLAGGDSDTKYSNTSSRISAMYRQAFSPVINRIKTTFEIKFDTEIKVDDSVLLKGDLASIVEQATKLAGGPVYTPNESRKEFFDKDEIDGGDTLRTGSGAVENTEDRSGEQPTDDGVLDNDDGSSD